MKKRSILIIVAVLLALTTMLVACNKDEDGDYTPADTTYVIQYTDDTGTYSIDVRQGQPYSMSNLPTREGYVFAGLYDAEQGGTQYVNAQGASLSPFNDGKNLVLFPQFKAKQYTLVLNYQGAEVSGVREMTVSYGSRITSLPIGLNMSNKEFMGWYTAPDRGGMQVADQYGVIPNNSIISSSKFDLTDKDGFIYLYAGFRGEMHTVTFYYGSGIAPDEMEIEHGTRISSIVTDHRNADGKAVVTWSKKDNDTDRTAVFNGKVESDLVLYALDYAPVLDFDANGGEEVDSIVATAGSAIVMPTTERENWYFAGWYSQTGYKYTGTTMPSSSLKLTAKWTPMLIFDERGGVEVEDIVAEQGTSVSLPTTSKDGYIFAGWYTEDGSEYTATAMPKNSVKLVAKYRKTLTKQIVLIEADTVKGGGSTPTRPTMTGSYAAYYEVDLSDLYELGVDNIKITAHYKTLQFYSTKHKSYMSWYNTATASDAYKIWSYVDSVDFVETWENKTHSTEIELTSPKLYVCRYTDGRYSSYDHAGYTCGQWTDFWVEVEYPDMTKLY